MKLIEVEKTSLEILPCPFCGAEAELLHGGGKASFNQAEKTSLVRCGRCGAQSKEVTISTEFSSDEAAIRLWNIRIIGV